MIERKLMQEVAFDFLASSSGGAFYNRLICTVARTPPAISNEVAVARLDELTRDIPWLRVVDDAAIEAAIMAVIASPTPDGRAAIERYILNAPNTFVSTSMRRLLEDMKPD